MVTLGIASFIRGGTQLAFRGVPGGIPLSIPSDPIVLNDLGIPTDNLVIALIAALSIMLIGWFHQRSLRGCPTMCRRASEHAEARDGHRRRELQPQYMKAGGDERRGKQHPFAERKVDHSRGLVDNDKGERDQSVQCAGQSALDEQREKK
jgi:hypothetical protein